jgi:hypothetical protein
VPCLLPAERDARGGRDGLLSNVRDQLRLMNDSRNASGGVCHHQEVQPPFYEKGHHIANQYILVDRQCATLKRISDAHGSGVRGPVWGHTPYPRMLTGRIAPNLRTMTALAARIERYGFAAGGAMNTKGQCVGPVGVNEAGNEHRMLGFGAVHGVNWCRIRACRKERIFSEFGVPPTLAGAKYAPLAQLLRYLTRLLSGKLLVFSACATTPATPMAPTS